MVNVAKQAQSCDSLVRYQEKEIVAGIRIQDACDSVIIIRQRQLDLASQEAIAWKERYKNQKEKTRLERKRKRNWRLVTLGVFALVIVDQVSQ